MSEASKEFDDVPVAIGPWGTVRHAMRANGVRESKVWLDAQSDATKSTLDQLLRKITSTGKISNLEQFRHLDDGIWEFKRGPHRLLAFQHGKCWWLTHYYPKAKKKCPPSEIQRAKTIRTEFFERLQIEECDKRT